MSRKWGLGAFILSLLLCTLFAQAQDQDLATSYRDQTAQLLVTIQATGIPYVACNVPRTNSPAKCLSVNDLSQQLKTVHFAVGVFDKPEMATRLMAFYSDTNTIFLNTAVTHPPEMRAFLGFHELLGSLGIAETEYQITLMAATLDQLLKGRWGHRNRKEDLINIRHNMQGGDTFFGAYDPSPITAANSVIIERPGGTSGGGTVVGGGGGDGDALIQRILFYKYVLDSQNKCWNNSTPTPISSIFKMNFPIEVIDGNFNEISYIPSKEFPLLPRHILVPTSWTKMAPTKDLLAPNRAAEDIAFFTSSIHQNEGLFCQFKVDWVLLNSELWAPHFWYPKKSDQIHPWLMKNYYQPLYQKNCPRNECKLTGAWGVFGQELQ